MTTAWRGDTETLTITSYSDQLDTLYLLAANNVEFKLGESESSMAMKASSSTSVLYHISSWTLATQVQCSACLYKAYVTVK